jgi:hypothetical protein
MPQSQGPDELEVVIKFGGGIHSRSPEDEIDIRECADGKNFDLDLKNKEFVPRAAFDLIGQVPNGGEIRGFATLQKADGTVSFLVQGGATVYEWDGAATFTSKGTVSSTAKLRGRKEHNWQLSDKVIITDLNLQQPVMEWDGSTLQNITFLDSDGSTPFGTFRAKYCVIDNERAIFSNIHDNGTNYPHLIVGAQRGDFTVITNNNRPSSSLNEGDPFFLIQPDYRSINGMVSAFRGLVTSSKGGSVYQLSGATAKDFALEPLFSSSGIDGDESFAYTDNDVVFGRQGRIASLVATEKYGDVSSADLSDRIFDKVKDYNNWTLAYNSRNQRLYCFPEGLTEAWIHHQSLPEFSKWAKITTNHFSAMQQTAVMPMLDPSDGLEYVFWGDQNGNVYRMEGSGLTDGGTVNIESERLSRLFVPPHNASVFDLQGWVRYRRDSAMDLQLSVEFIGKDGFTKKITIPLQEKRATGVYYGAAYYGAAHYAASGAARLSTEDFTIPGQSAGFQVRTTVNSEKSFSINEIGVKFTAAS